MGWELLSEGWRGVPCLSLGLWLRRPFSCSFRCFAFDGLRSPQFLLLTFSSPLKPPTREAERDKRGQERASRKQLPGCLRNAIDYTVGYKGGCRTIVLRCEVRTHQHHVDGGVGACEKPKSAKGCFVRQRSWSFSSSDPPDESGFFLFLILWSPSVRRKERTHRLGGGSDGDDGLRADVRTLDEGE